MYKKINLLKCMSAILFFFILGLASISVAGNCGDCDEPPTIPGNACKCDGTKPTINATFAEGMDTIDSSNPVTLSASGGCPPYIWSVTGTGYDLSDNGNGTKKLSVVSGTCIKNVTGNYDIYATVTVTDKCDLSNEVQVRHTSGTWVSKGTGKGVLVSCTYNRYIWKRASEFIIGHQRWLFTNHPWHFNRACTESYWEVASGTPVEPSVSPIEAHKLYSDCDCGGNSVGHSNSYSYYEWECP
jgi:hypothetical protein